MIRIEDLQEAIAECEGVRNPNANTCIKLASFYTILNQMQGKTAPEPLSLPMYSYAPEPQDVEYVSDTEFGKIVQGKKVTDVMKVMDELMSTLQVMIPRLYDGVIIKLQK